MKAFGIEQKRVGQSLPRSRVSSKLAIEKCINGVGDIHEGPEAQGGRRNNRMTREGCNN